MLGFGVLGVALAAAPGAAAVTIDNFTFSPAPITVAAGTTVTWTNNDDIPHTVRAVDGSFHSKAMDTDDSYAFTFTKPGVYSYFCSIHPEDGRQGGGEVEARARDLPPLAARMSGRLLPFRRSAASSAASGPAGFSSAPRGAPRRAEPAGAAAPFPRPSEAPRFRELIAPHIDAAYSLARYLARDAAAAEDIAQEALLKAFRNIDSLRGGEVKPWLMAIVRNAYFDWRRRDNGRTRHRSGRRGRPRRDAGRRQSRPRTR